VSHGAAFERLDRADPVTFGTLSAPDLPRKVAAMSSDLAGVTPLPAGTAVPPGSLRAELDARRARGERFSVREAVGLIVPLCTALAELHGKGKRLFITPSSLRPAPSGAHIVEDLAVVPPTHPRDHACLAPEERRGAAGDARASVFTVGAILYEMITGATVGPAMRRPSELVPGLPASLEVVLGKALVADPAHRPADLSALAQALYHLAPTASMAPPQADESHLDHDADFDVDVSLSMLPPPPSMRGGAALVAAPMPVAKPIAAPFHVAVHEVPSRPAAVVDPTLRLAELKAALEADPRPRYVVVKDGMDHGPFTAVELLQQIATGAFHARHRLRDTFSGDERPIGEWEEFSPFADQAKLNREIVREKHAIEAATKAETKGQRYKTAIGVAVVALLGLGGAAYWYQESRARDRELTVQADRALAVDVDAGLGAEKVAGKPKVGGGGRAASGSDKVPTVTDRGSCEAAINAYVEEYKIGNDGVPPDLGAADYGAVLNRGGYLNACGVPSDMEVSICAAVQNGRAVGVTVTTSPSSPGVASCVARQVRGLGFPSHPRLDVARTTFAAN
jgi:hypothetical protein